MGLIIGLFLRATISHTRPHTLECAIWSNKFANNENEAPVYQAFEIVFVEHILEGNVISKPQLLMPSVIMVSEKHIFESGKVFRIFLQGRSYR